MPHREYGIKEKRRKCMFNTAIWVAVVFFYAFMIQGNCGGYVSAFGKHYKVCKNGRSNWCTDYYRNLSKKKIRKLNHGG